MGKGPWTYGTAQGSPTCLGLPENFRCEKGLVTKHKSNCHNAQSRVHKIKYRPKWPKWPVTTQVVRQGGAKSDGWTSVKEGGSEKTSEQQKNSANDDQPNTNVVFYKVGQTWLGFAVTKAIIGVETSSSQSHSMFYSPPMINFFQCLCIPHICHESHENSRVNFFWPL